MVQTTEEATATESRQENSDILAGWNAQLTFLKKVYIYILMVIDSLGSCTVITRGVLA